MNDDNKNPLEVDTKRGDLPRTTSELKRLCEKVFGPLARVWTRDGKVQVGMEQGDAKAVFASGRDPAEAFLALIVAAQRATGKFD